MAITKVSRLGVGLRHRRARATLTRSLAPRCSIVCDNTQVSNQLLYLSRFSGASAAAPLRASRRSLFRRLPCTTPSPRLVLGLVDWSREVLGNVLAASLCGGNPRCRNPAKSADCDGGAAIWTRMTRFARGVAHVSTTRQMWYPLSTVRILCKLQVTTHAATSPEVSHDSVLLDNTSRPTFGLSDC